MIPLSAPPPSFIVYKSLGMETKQNKFPIPLPNKVTAYENGYKLSSSGGLLTRCRFVTGFWYKSSPQMEGSLTKPCTTLLLRNRSKKKNPVFQSYGRVDRRKEVVKF